MYKTYEIVKLLDLYYIVASLPYKDNRYTLYQISTGRYIPNIPEVNISKKVDQQEFAEAVASKIKVINYKISSEVFSLSKAKYKLLGQTFTNYKKEYSFNCKKDGLTRDTIIVQTDNGTSLRFVKEDIEFLYELPKITIQKPLVDKTIRTGDKIILVKSQKLPIRKGSLGVVINIETGLKYSYKNQYIKDTKNKPLDIVTILDNETKREYRTYCRNIKKLENDKNN